MSNEKMSSEITLLIKKYFNESDDWFTHTTMMKPYKKLTIDRKAMCRFWDKYDKLIHGNIEIISAITEKPQYYSMLVADIDIVASTDQELKEIHSNENVRELIMKYFEVLKRFGVSDDLLECVYLSKEPYIKDNKLKQGFHLQFTKIFLSLPNRNKIREQVQAETTTFVLDKIENKNWLLYGSRKSSTTGTYKIYNIFKWNNEKGLLLEIPIDEYMKNYICYDWNEKRIKTTPTRMLSIYTFNRPEIELA